MPGKSQKKNSSLMLDMPTSPTLSYWKISGGLLRKRVSNYMGFTVTRGGGATYRLEVWDKDFRWLLVSRLPIGLKMSIVWFLMGVRLKGLFGRLLGLPRSKASPISKSTLTPTDSEPIELWMWTCLKPKSEQRASRLK